MVVARRISLAAVRLVGSAQPLPCEPQQWAWATEEPGGWSWKGGFQKEVTYDLGAQRRLHCPLPVKIIRHEAPLPAGPRCLFLQGKWVTPQHPVQKHKAPLLPPGAGHSSVHWLLGRVSISRKNAQTSQNCANFNGNTAQLQWRMKALKQSQAPRTLDVLDLDGSSNSLNQKTLTHRKRFNLNLFLMNPVGPAFPTLPSP